jgi:hypothetical protein
MVVLHQVQLMQHTIIINGPILIGITYCFSINQTKERHDIYAFLLHLYSYPHIKRWYSHISSFTDAARTKWTSSVASPPTSVSSSSSSGAFRVGEEVKLEVDEVSRYDALSLSNSFVIRLTGLHWYQLV